MNSNSRYPIIPPQHDWWRLHINVSIVPTRINTCLQLGDSTGDEESKPKISLVMFRNFDTNGFKEKIL